MTNRLNYSIYWARDGQVADPDLDTEHPLYLPNRYQGIGWQVEKPPEQWENFCYQNNDLKIEYSLLQGFQPYDEGVAYRPGALTVFDGTLYVNNSGKVLQGVYPDDSDNTFALLGIDFILGVSRLAVTGWAKVLSVSEEEYNLLLNDMKSSLANHLAAMNPHEDTIEEIGGVNKDYVDLGFGDPADPRTIVYHTNLKNTLDAHHETPAQIGTLPTSGGKFTGDVEFKKIILDVDTAIQLVVSTGQVVLQIGSDVLSLDSGGSARFNSYLIATKVNMSSIQNKLNYAYTLPSPLLTMNVKAGLSDVTAIGNWTIDSAADSDTNAGGLEFKTNAVTMEDGLSSIAATVYFSGTDGTSSVRTITDLNITSMDDLSAFLSSVAPTATHVGYIKIYPTLTAKQKLNLVI
ncbi:tail fiber protein [Erwinia phage Faunus]|uniref:Uncharacterized protein n=1 Tax=Erwinia phage Faunus TaxID=2182346 RepID=A0A2U8UX00_9CAUD|nr:tail fiber protein [Erwinia phage Faunus]AWN08654.1 hypothetical protein [Erwinia phage Faunus]